MKKILLFLSIIAVISCKNTTKTAENQSNKQLDSLAQEVIDETARTWEDYKKYAWGHDALKPLSKSFSDWYEKPLYISPIDAYSTLHLMGLKDEAKEIEQYVIDSLDFNLNIDAKIFEVNIRILGGLLSMYDISQNEKILAKAKDFADRMLPAFNTKTGIPKYWVNLSTGVARGDTVNVAEAATYTMEMGILSYYTKDPKYYQAGKKATKAIFESRSEIGLIGDIINVETGEWVSRKSHICAGVDSYYEYMYKSFVLFGDPELKSIWDESIEKIQKYIAEEHNGKLWYGRVNMDSGKKVSSVVTLYDAFFPATLVLSGDTANAIKYQKSWDWLWTKYGLEPMAYDYKKDEPTYPAYDLNPEIAESAYYLYHFTKDSTFLEMSKKYWRSLKEFCKNDVGFASIKDVTTMEKKDYMPTFFFAETLKYLYLNFSLHQNKFNFDAYVFNTEAHQFERKNFDKEKAKNRLGF